MLYPYTLPHACKLCHVLESRLVLEKRALYIRISNTPHVTALCVGGFVSHDMYDWYDLGMDRRVWVSACTAAVCDIVW